MIIIIIQSYYLFKGGIQKLVSLAILDIQSIRAGRDFRSEPSKLTVTRNLLIERSLHNYQRGIWPALSVTEAYAVFNNKTLNLDEAIQGLFFLVDFIVY